MLPLHRLSVHKLPKFKEGQRLIFCLWVTRIWIRAETDIPSGSNTYEGMPPRNNSNIWRYSASILGDFRLGIFSKSQPNVKENGWLVQKSMLLYSSEINHFLLFKLISRRFRKYKMNILFLLKWSIAQLKIQDHSLRYFWTQKHAFNPSILCMNLLILLYQSFIQRMYIVWEAQVQTESLLSISKVQLL